MIFFDFTFLHGPNSEFLTMTTAFVLSALILIAGIAGYIGITKDPWYRRKLDRNKYPFEELADSPDDGTKQEIDNIIKEFEEKKR